MDELATAARYGFWLLLFLIAVAYFAGFVADSQALGGAVNSLGLTFSGRNASGNFASYPAGASTTEIAATSSHATPHPTNAAA